MSKKVEILNEMLNKGYINQEKYQELSINEEYSEEDIALYNHIKEAYATADDSSNPIENFKGRFIDGLHDNYFK